MRVNYALALQQNRVYYRKQDQAGAVSLKMHPVTVAEMIIEKSLKSLFQRSSREVVEDVRKCSVYFSHFKKHSVW